MTSNSVVTSNALSSEQKIAAIYAMLAQAMSKSSSPSTIPNDQPLYQHIISKPNTSGQKTILANKSSPKGPVVPASNSSPISSHQIPTSSTKRPSITKFQDSNIPTPRLNTASTKSTNPTTSSSSVVPTLSNHPIHDSKNFTNSTSVAELMMKLSPNAKNVGASHSKTSIQPANTNLNIPPVQSTSKVPVSTPLDPVNYLAQTQALQAQLVQNNPPFQLPTSHNINQLLGPKFYHRK